MDQAQRRVLTGIVLVLALLALPLIGVLLTSLAVSPEAIESGAVQLTAPCPRLVAGEWCASCGLTRSFTAMSRLRLNDAWAYNRAGPLLYLLSWLALTTLVGLIRRLLGQLRTS